MIVERPPLYRPAGRGAPADPSRRPTRLSLVIPAYNEVNRLASGLPRLIDAIPSDTEVIVVDDGSSDGTLDLARRHLAGLPRRILVRLPHNRGKGAAVRAGVVQARGDVIAYLDADMATDPRDLVRLVEALGSSPIAVGSRSLRSSVVEKKSRHRTLMTRSFGLLVASTLDLPMRDTQCGFKAFHGSVAKLLFHGATVDRFAFDVELLNRATRLGLRVEEVPVRWTDVSGSKVRVVQDSLKMLLDVGRTRRGLATALPIQGIAVSDADPRETARRLRSAVRPVDPVLWWEGGAVALFPCVAPTVADRIRRRVQGRLADYRLHHAELPFDALGRSRFDPESIGA
ncbi:MAG: dolichyl-phosphate beta-glucosyltransferase [Acidimicrobiales bacterium]